MKKLPFVLALVVLGVGAVGCGDDEPENQTSQTLCEKYGGPSSVASVVQEQVLDEIAGDCRINTFFLSLPAAGLTHVAECLTTQVQELFGCEGITYAGSQDSAGAACRSMVQAHSGLGISDGDFSALIEDVVAGLQEAGVAQADIDAAAPALLGLQDDIVEDSGNSAETQSTCQ